MNTKAIGEKSEEEAHMTANASIVLEGKAPYR